MATVRVSTTILAPPATAERLWFDTSRWPAFVEGFRTLVEVSDGWPAAGSRAVWDSSPQGRGRVLEAMTGTQPGTYTSDITDPRMHGTQTITFAGLSDGGTEATVALAYTLRGDVPKLLRPVVDAMFVRRQIHDALARTLESFAIEAEEEARLTA